MHGPNRTDTLPHWGPQSDEQHSTSLMCQVLTQQLGADHCVSLDLVQLVVELFHCYYSNRIVLEVSSPTQPTTRRGSHLLLPGTTSPPKCCCRSLPRSQAGWLVEIVSTIHVLHLSKLELEAAREATLLLVEAVAGTTAAATTTTKECLEDLTRVNV